MDEEWEEGDEPTSTEMSKVSLSIYLEPAFLHHSAQCCIITPITYLRLCWGMKMAL